MHRERGVFSDLRIVTGSELVMPFQEEEFSLPGQLNENVCSLHIENRKVQWLTDWQKKKWIIRKICPYTNQWYHRFEYCIQVQTTSLRKKKGTKRTHSKRPKCISRGTRRKGSRQTLCVHPVFRNSPMQNSSSNWNKQQKLPHRDVSPPFHRLAKKSIKAGL